MSKRHRTNDTDDDEESTPEEEFVPSSGDEEEEEEVVVTKQEQPKKRVPKRKKQPRTREPSDNEDDGTEPPPLEAKEEEEVTTPAAPPAEVIDLTDSATPAYLWDETPLFRRWFKILRDANDVYYNKLKEQGIDVYTDIFGTVFLDGVVVLLDIVLDYIWMEDRPDVICRFESRIYRQLHHGLLHKYYTLVQDRSLLVRQKSDSRLLYLYKIQETNPATGLRVSLEHSICDHLPSRIAAIPETGELISAHFKKDDVYHRIGGLPAFWSNTSHYKRTEYIVHGKLDRNPLEGPAYVTESKYETTRMYIFKGRITRSGHEPALEQLRRDRMIRMYFNKDGVLDRNEHKGPAVEIKYRDKETDEWKDVHYEYHKDGRPHRKKMSKGSLLPAMLHNGERYYFVDGQECETTAEPESRNSDDKTIEHLKAHSKNVLDNVLEQDTRYVHAMYSARTLWT